MRIATVIGVGLATTGIACGQSQAESSSPWSCQSIAVPGGETIECQSSAVGPSGAPVSCAAGEVGCPPAGVTIEASAPPAETTAEGADGGGAPMSMTSSVGSAGHPTRGTSGGEGGPPAAASLECSVPDISGCATPNAPNGGNRPGSGRGDGDASANGPGAGRGNGNGNNGNGHGGGSMSDACAAPSVASDACAGMPTTGESPGSGTVETSDGSPVPTTSESPSSGTVETSDGSPVPTTSDSPSFTCTDAPSGRKCVSTPTCLTGSHPSACGACIPDGTTEDCESPAQGGCWMTGGGFILDSDGRDSFGGNAKPMKDGSVQGEWENVDHDTGNKAHGTPSYLYCRHVDKPGPGQPGGKNGLTANQVYFGGPARWFVAASATWADGYWFDVVAEDHGEGQAPPDSYQITVRLEAGANVSGAIVFQTGGDLGGGNIQLHPPNSGHPYLSSALPPWVQVQP